MSTDIKDLRSLFQTVNKLLQRSIENHTLWISIIKKSKSKKYFDVFYTNEDLLNLITSNSKQNLIISLYVLCDDTKNGNKGHSIFTLLDKCEATGIDAEQLDKLKSTLKNLNPIIKKIRIIRNNQIAHVSAGKEWKENFKKLPKAEIETLIKTLSIIVSVCSKHLKIPILSHSNISETTIIYSDRLIRALETQIKNKDVGKDFLSFATDLALLGEPEEPDWVSKAISN